MKVVSWNCNGAFRKKYCYIEDAYSPDLMVIQECEDPAQSTAAYKEWAGNYLWVGTSKNKGIGIFDRSDLGITSLDWDAGPLELFLPCTVANTLVLGVWTKYANSPNFRYIGQLWKYLQLHKAKLEKSERTLICGDWNSNPIWDEWDRWWNHSDVTRELADIGITSLYHNSTNETAGQELTPTLYHQKNPDKPYHVDYALASKTIRSDGIQIGSINDWLKHSDHMPLVFSVE